MKMTSLGKNPVSLLRIMVGAIFITHGLARLYYWSVPDFGGFLAASGLPFGLVLAWTITVGEILSGSLLIPGKYVRYCVLFHATVVLGGIFMVHLQNGWFVVGHGANGIEYSMLLLVALFTVYRGELATTS